MVLSANFNLYKQCPQIYIYIFAILTSALVSLKLGTINEVMISLISGALMTFILMGINYCDWNFQFITWLFSFIFICISIINIFLFLFLTPEEIV